MLVACLFSSALVMGQERPDFPRTLDVDQRGGGLKIPYPIIYVHGLVGNAASWEEMSSFMTPALGPPVELRFCLNADGSLYTSNAAYDIASFIPSNLISANHYLINFNCNSSNLCDASVSMDQSNQSGIYKQAEAIGIAIDEVLDATGANKVILLGHSMGGVASREYLQNGEHWQNPSGHRLAKLVTSGSPHVGFDLGSKLAKWPGVIQGIDVDSEAVRDLKNRHTGPFESNLGVFLWGGEESQTYMYDDIFTWYNVDVNCNGITGTTVTGLNERTMPNDLEFASLYDTNDLIVTSAWPLFHNIPGDLTAGEDLCSVLDNGWNGSFSCESWGWNVEGGVTLGHNELPDQTVETLWALDEADDYSKSYEIVLDETYVGFLTPQSSSTDMYEGYSGYDSDYDDYIITIPSGGGSLAVTASFEDYYATGSSMILLKVNPDGSLSLVTGIEDVGTMETMEANVSGGQYILEFIGNVSNELEWGLYVFTLSLNQTNSVTEPVSSNGIEVWPNPASEEIQISLGEFNEGAQEVQLADLNGKIVLERRCTFPASIDVSAYEQGMYILSVSGGESKHSQIVAIKK